MSGSDPFGMGMRLTVSAGAVCLAAAWPARLLRKDQRLALFDKDRISLAQDVELGAGDLAGNANRQTRARKTDRGRRPPRGGRAQVERPTSCLNASRNNFTSLMVHALGHGEATAARVHLLNQVRAEHATLTPCWHPKSCGHQQTGY